MNSYMVKKLFQKDWYLVRYNIYGCTLMGFIGLIMFLLGGFYGIYLGAVTLDIAIIILMTAVFLPVIINERKDQTLAFLMSLPVGNLEYTLAKTLAGLCSYFCTWLLLYLAAIAVLLLRTDLNPNVIPYFSMMYGLALMFYCLIFAVAVVTESERWSMLVFAIGNITIQVSLGLGLTYAGFRESVSAPTMLWNKPILMVIAIELVVIVVSITAMFFLQLRKKDFL